VASIQILVSKITTVIASTRSIVIIRNHYPDPFTINAQLNLFLYVFCYLMSFTIASMPFTIEAT